MAKNRTVGAVTGAATAGGGLGAALGAILVHLVPSLEPVSGPIVVVLTVALSLLGGYLSPPKEPDTTIVEIPVNHAPEDPFAGVDVDGDPFADVPEDFVEDGSVDFARHVDE